MTAKVLTLDVERVPMWTKPLPAWDMKSLQYRRLSPDDIARVVLDLAVDESAVGECRVVANRGVRPAELRTIARAVGDGLRGVRGPGPR